MIIEMDSTPKSFITIDSNYIITSKDMQNHQIHVDSNAGAVNVSIPIESGTFYARKGDIFEVINLGTNNVMIDRIVTDTTINGGSSFTISIQWKRIIIQKIATNTWIVY